MSDYSAKSHTELIMVFLYIDPGAGSMVIQVVIAGALAVPFFLRNQIGRLIARVRARPTNEDRTQPDA